MRAKVLLSIFALLASMTTFAQFDTSGISAGFFDSSENNNLNFSNFHLPPLGVLFENAKATPGIMTYVKAQEMAKAELAKQKRQPFNWIHGHGSYSYGKTDMWGNNSSNYSQQMVYQFQGSEQSYWNVGVSVSASLGDILDIGPGIRRKRIEVEQAKISKDKAYDELKLEIARLYVKITNGIITLKSAAEHAAIYQAAGSLNQEEFENGNLSIREFAETKRYEDAAVNTFQQMQASIITDIITLEIMTHTPIITNTTTDITLDDEVLTESEIKKQNKRVEKDMKQKAKEEQKRVDAKDKADEKAAKEAAKAEQKALKKAEKK